MSFALTSSKFGEGARGEYAGSLSPTLRSSITAFDGINAVGSSLSWTGMLIVNPMIVLFTGCTQSWW